MTTQTSTRNTSAVAGFVDDLNGAVRENPVAAGLVGFGVLWMFLGGARSSGVGSAMSGVARSVANELGGAAELTGDVVGETVRGAARRVSEVSRQVSDEVSSKAGGAATMAVHEASIAYAGLKARGEKADEIVTRTAEQAGRSATEFRQEIGMSMQQNLTKTFEAQPLLLGVIGIAIGAGIASAFPSTKMEQNVMGEAGAALKDVVQEIATETSERAKDVFVEVKKEAAAQGLTPAAAQDGFRGVAEKVKTAAMLSQESMKERLS